METYALTRAWPPSSGCSMHNEYLAERAPWTLAKDRPTPLRSTGVVHGGREPALATVCSVPSAGIEPGHLARSGRSHAAGPIGASWSTALAHRRRTDRDRRRGDLAPPLSPRSPNRGAPRAAHPSHLTVEIRSIVRVRRAAPHRPPPVRCARGRTTAHVPGANPVQLACPPHRALLPSPGHHHRRLHEDRMRVGKVLAAEIVPKSKKLLKLTVQDGPDSERTIWQALPSLRPDAIVGRTIAFVANSRPVR